MIIKVIKPGMYSTLQDEGRVGQQDVGIPVGGAQDREAYDRANLLVGNERGAPVIEATLIGPSLYLDDDCIIAITGGGMKARINGVDIEYDRRIECGAGSKLTFSPAPIGCRTYIAVGGCWEVERWHNSVSPMRYGKSTLPISSILQSGQEISIRPHLRSSFDLSVERSGGASDELVVSSGPEFHLFNHLDIARFFSTPFTISNDSNRMGYRLHGYKIDVDKLPPMISSAVMPGTVQITREGLPIVLLNDAQTVGGYLRIAQLSNSALNKIAQKRPMDTVRFRMR